MESPAIYVENCTGFGRAHASAYAHPRHMFAKRLARVHREMVAVADYPALQTVGV